jgi:hypothetical protein
MWHATNIPGQKVYIQQFVPAPLPPELNWTRRLIGLFSDAGRGREFETRRSRQFGAIIARRISSATFHPRSRD